MQDTQELKIIDASTLPVETENFDGISLPFYKDKQYGALDLSAYQGHLNEEVKKTLQEEAGLVLKFSGFTNSDIQQQGISNPDAEVLFSNKIKKFVFKEGNLFYDSHILLSSRYNDDVNNTVRQDKIFFNYTNLYIYNPLDGGIMIIKDQDDIDNILNKIEKHIVISEEEFNSLEQKDDSSIYLIF